MYPLKPSDPQRIGIYVLSGRLGAGGMGEVFMGRSPGGRVVAVKLIYPLFANDAEFRRRFRLEVEAGRKVGGFHTAHVVDADPDADRPWMVTAYVEGPSLGQVLDRYHELPLRSTRVLGAGLAEALVTIHAAGIVHRDLKPSNILLANDGPRVIDFGIARAIDASGITARHGTPGFMAPEVLKRETIAPACDVFSLGVVLAFAGGIRPFGVGPPEAIDYRVVHEEPDLRGLDPFVGDLVAKCLLKEPGDRPKPTQILDFLADQDSVAHWLPDPIRDMITAWRSPALKSAVIYANPLDESQLLAEAEQIARGLPDEYERASALVHVAAVVSRFDSPHAARLLDDARYPIKNGSEVANQWRGPLVEYLIESSAVEVGTVVGRIDSTPADQMLVAIAAYSELLTHRNMGVEEETAKVIIALAEAAACTNPDRADRIVRSLADESLQSTAVARVAIVAAHTDPARAEQMARAITSRIEQMPRPVAAQDRKGRSARKWRRAQSPRTVPAAGTHFDHHTAKYWAARALAEIAIGMTDVDLIRLGRLPTDAEYFARTVTAVGNSYARGPSPVRTAAIDPARAARCLRDAEQLALSIAASSFTASGVATADLRAGALTAVKSAAARIDRARAGVLLAEAEQAARTISNDSGRFEALAQAALAAARTDTARAEQIARSLLHLPHKLGDLALVVALSDPVRAERIAATITDEYLRALVRAVLAVQFSPDSAGTLLREAENAARGIPARVIEVAMVIARTDPARAEQIARTIDNGPEIIYLQQEGDKYERSATTGYMRSAEYWRAHALADLATVSYESRPGRN